jgi:hypothetical protein
MAVIVIVIVSGSSSTSATGSASCAPHKYSLYPINRLIIILLNSRYHKYILNISNVVTNFTQLKPHCLMKPIFSEPLNKQYQYLKSKYISSLYQNIAAEIIIKKLNKISNDKFEKHVHIYHDVMKRFQCCILLPSNHFR